MKHKTHIFALGLCAFVLGAMGAHYTYGAEAALPSFKYVSDTIDPNVSVPTVVEVSINEARFVRTEFAVLEKETGVFQPWYLYRSRNVQETSFVASRGVGEGAMMLPEMTDRDAETTSVFTVSENGGDMVSITCVADEAMTATGLRISLAPFVSLPTEMEIVAETEGVETIAFSRDRIESAVVRFPEMTADVWTIRMWYAQPLSIEEISFIEVDQSIENRTGIRFLARPDHTYAIYADPDTSVRIQAGEAGDLLDNKGVKVFEDIFFGENDEYIPTDSDGDGVADIIDNCVRVANQDQMDKDGNFRGDACDDFDKDGVINAEDNCPDHPNIQQIDTDGDGVGDVCDSEESRLTERLPWLPWIGMLVSALIVGGLLYVTVRSKRSGGDPAQ
jgi:hypothetical protein